MFHIIFSIIEGRVGGDQMFGCLVGEQKRKAIFKGGGPNYGTEKERSCLMFDSPHKEKIKDILI